MTEVSYAQHGIWVTEQVGAGSAYHMPIVVHFAAPPDQGALAKACANVVERHPLLASAVEERDGVLHLVPAAVPPALVVTEESGAFVREETLRPFELERGPLVRFALAGSTLVIVAHHVVFDGLSKDVLVADLAAFLSGALPPPLEPADHAADQRVRVAAAQEEAREFWASRWREPGETVVPGGSLRSRSAGRGQVLEFPVEIPSLPGLTRLEVLLAAVHALLASYGNADVVTALDLSTRTPAQAGHIGPFVNELPVFSRPRPGAPFAEFAAELRAELRQLYGYREVPLARAVAGIKPHAALAPVSVSYRRAAGTAAGTATGSTTASAVESAAGFAKVEWLAFNHAVRGALQLQIVDGPEGATASLRYGEELAAPERFAADLRALLADVTQDPARPLSSLGSPGDISEMSPMATLGTTITGPATAVPATAALLTDPGPAGSVGPAGGGQGASVPGGSPSGDLADPLLAEIRAIWEEVLQLSPVDQHDDIFDLGGHSLTITQIIARMRKRLGVEVDIDDFFDNPTIAGVLEVIRR